MQFVFQLSHCHFSKGNYDIFIWQGFSFPSLNLYTLFYPQLIDNTLTTNSFNRPSVTQDINSVKSKLDPPTSSNIESLTDHRLLVVAWGEVYVAGSIKQVCILFGLAGCRCCHGCWRNLTFMCRQRNIVSCCGEWRVFVWFYWLGGRSKRRYELYLHKT